MRLVRSTLICLSVVCALTAIAQDDPAYRYRDQPSGEYFRAWMIAGPFPAGDEIATDVHQARFDEDFLRGEARIEPSDTDDFKADGAGGTWKVHRSESDTISLDEAVSKADHVLAYAYAEIEMQRAEPCLLALGSNDGVRVWLNGEVVWDAPAARPLAHDRDLVPIVLKKGTNRLLLKIEERANRWEFSARLLSMHVNINGQTQLSDAVDRLELLRVETSEDGRPRLIYPFAASTLEGPRSRTGTPSGTRFVAVPRVSIREERTGRLIWERGLNGETSLELPIKSEEYGRYELEARLVFRAKLERTISLSFEAGKRVEHVLFDNGTSAYSIAVGESASESEKWAAQELQHWLQEVGGVELPVVSGSVREPAIYVGLSEIARDAIAEHIEAPTASDESFTYRNAGNSIMIWGGRDRGTMYGVLSFLEREMGVRWYTPTVSAAPKKSRYAFTYLNHRESPSLRVRNDFYFEAFDSTWAARNRVNGAMGLREQPGGVEGYWGVHTFYPFVPPDKYFAEHPEYFSVIDGKRTTERAQLCLTNSDVLDIVTEQLLKTIEENPGYLIYCVSQNDWYGACQCDACQAIVTGEGSEAGPMIWFVNQVAERVEPKHPDKFVGTLAYQYTRKPPKTLRPRENVVVRLCSIECCFAHDFANCPENEEFLSDLEGWAKIAPHMYIWDYVVNFSNYVMPYPNFRVLAPNLQAFQRNNAIGVMEQAAYQSRGGEFAELRAYVLAKLLWNTGADVDAIVDDFMFGYYGRSGQYVRDYFDSLHAQLTPDTHIHLGMQPDDKLFTDAWIAEADAMFDAAERVADDDAILHRVELARLPLMYLKCRRDPKTSVYDGTWDSFKAIAEREQVTHFAESGPAHRDPFYTQMERWVAERADN